MIYAPDYVINGGGVINVYGELQGWDHRSGQAQGGADLRHAAPASTPSPARQKIPSYRAADRMAEQRIAAVAG